MARKELIADVSRRWVRDRPRLGWMDGMKMALDSRGINVVTA